MPETVRTLATPKVNANGAKNPTLSFRVRGDLYDRLRDQAQSDSYSLSEAIERRLTKSFEDEQRIAELERHIDVMKQTERLLWPDDSARILGQGFAMALSAARHASGKDWREDRSAALVVAGAVRRTMDRYTRDGMSIVADLFDGAQVAAMADSIVETVGPYLDKVMPPLPEPPLDAAKWTGRIYLVTEFREAGTAHVLETVTGPEFDAADPEGRPARGDRYRAALARFAPIRDTVDAEDFEVFVMRDGTHKRVSVDGTHGKTTPQPEEPATRLTGPEEAAALMAGTKPAPGQEPELFDRAIVDDAAAGLPLVKAERAAAAERRTKAPLDIGSGPPEATEPAPAPKRRGRTKTPA